MLWNIHYCFPGTLQSKLKLDVIQAFVSLTDREMQAYTRPQSRLWLSQDRDRTYLVSSPRHSPLEITAHADLASVGSPREGGADLSCWIRSSPSLMTLRVASRVAVCCCWNCLISSWTASTESAQTSSSTSFWRSSIHVHSCVRESRDCTGGQHGVKSNKSWRGVSVLSSTPRGQCVLLTDVHYPSLASSSLGWCSLRMGKPSISVKTAGLLRAKKFLIFETAGRTRDWNGQIFSFRREKMRGSVHFPQAAKYGFLEVDHTANMQNNATQ